MSKIKKNLRLWKIRIKIKRFSQRPSPASVGLKIKNVRKYFISYFSLLYIDYKYK